MAKYESQSIISSIFTQPARQNPAQPSLTISQKYIEKASTTARALQSSNTHITRQKQQLTVNISSSSIKKMFERNHSNRTEKKHKKFFGAKSDGK